MKKILVALILGVLLPQVAGAQRPARIATDTLPCGVRQPNYWYSDWFDTTDWYLYGSALDYPYPREWSGWHRAVTAEQTCIFINLKIFCYEKVINYHHSGSAAVACGDGAASVG